MRTIKIDPRVFISAPYVTCPKCKKETFGVLTIHDHHYNRRCRECFFPNPHEGERWSRDLPTIRKKVIYLDQLAISNMMKALNPETKANQQGKYQAGTDGERWLTLFNKLYRLYRMQLILCPTSRFHRKESAVDSHAKALKRIYELLSHNVSFLTTGDIQRLQIETVARSFLAGTEPCLDLDPRSVVSDDIDAWTDTIMVSVSFRQDDQGAERLRQFREQVEDTMISIFEGWKKSSGRSFDQFKKGHYEGFWFEAFRMYRDMQALGQMFGAPSHVWIIGRVWELFTHAGLPEAENITRVVDFFLSPKTQRDVPYCHISALLYAALAREASSPGSTMTPPNRGTYYDTQMIATLLPYCDAMLVDNQWRGYMEKEPLRKELASYKTEIFSPNTMPKLMSYLEEIEQQATSEHLEKVAEVYGEIKPFTTIFQPRRRE